jgi:hypothetical protein
MKKVVGKFEAAGLAFAQEALEAVGIEYAVSDDSAGARWSVAAQRMVEAPAMFDLLVEDEQLAAAKVAVERWQKEAEEAALRESGAPPPTPEELEADAEWERQKHEDRARERAPFKGKWTLLAIGGAVFGGLAWLITHR